MNEGYMNRPGPNQWYSPPWEVGNGTGAGGASSVPNQGNFADESWQDGISRRIHHGCNEEELAEARYHDRMREQAFSSGQQYASYAPYPTPPAEKTREQLFEEQRELRSRVRREREEKEERNRQDSFRRTATDLRHDSARNEAAGDVFNQKMREQTRLARQCAEVANVGGYTDTDGSSVDFVDLPAYEKCVSSGGMPMVRLNVPDGHSLRYDKQAKNVAIDRRACLRERATETLAYSAAAGAGGFLFAKDNCPKTTVYPYCVAGITAGAGVVNGYRGWRDAGNSSACQPQAANEKGGDS